MERRDSINNSLNVSTFKRYSDLNNSRYSNRHSDEHLREHLETKRLEIRRLRLEKEAYRTEVQSIKAEQLQKQCEFSQRTAELENERLQFQQILQHKEQQLTQREGALRQQTTHLQQQQNEYDLLCQQIEEEHQAEGEQEERIGELHNQLTETTQQVAALKQLVTEERKTNEKLEAKRVELEKTVEMLLGKNQELSQQRLQLQDIEEKNKSLNEALAKLDAMKRDIGTEDLKKKRQSLKLEAERIEQQKVELASVCKKIETEKRELKAQRTELDEKWNELHLTKEANEKEMSVLKQVSNKVYTNEAAVSRQLQAVEEQSKVVRHKETTIEAEKSRVQNEFAVLVAQQQSWKHNLAALEKKMEGAVDNMDKVVIAYDAKVAHELTASKEWLHQHLKLQQRENACAAQEKQLSQETQLLRKQRESLAEDEANIQKEHDQLKRTTAHFTVQATKGVQNMNNLVVATEKKMELTLKASQDYLERQHNVTQREKQLKTCREELELNKNQLKREKLAFLTDKNIWEGRCKAEKRQLEALKDHGLTMLNAAVGAVAHKTTVMNSSAHSLTNSWMLEISKMVEEVQTAQNQVDIQKESLKREAQALSVAQESLVMQQKLLNLSKSESSLAAQLDDNEHRLKTVRRVVYDPDAIYQNKLPTFDVDATIQIENPYFSQPLLPQRSQSQVTIISNKMDASPSTPTLNMTIGGSEVLIPPTPSDPFKRFCVQDTNTQRTSMNLIVKNKKKKQPAEMYTDLNKSLMAISPANFQLPVPNQVDDISATPTDKCTVTTTTHIHTTHNQDNETVCTLPCCTPGAKGPVVVTKLVFEADTKQNSAECEPTDSTCDPSKTSEGPQPASKTNDKHGTEKQAQIEHEHQDTENLVPEIPKVGTEKSVQKRDTINTATTTISNLQEEEQPNKEQPIQVVEMEEQKIQKVQRRKHKESKGGRRSKTISQLFTAALEDSCSSFDSKPKKKTRKSKQKKDTKKQATAKRSTRNRIAKHVSTDSEDSGLECVATRIKKRKQPINQISESECEETCTPSRPVDTSHMRITRSSTRKLTNTEVNSSAVFGASPLATAAPRVFTNKRMARASKVHNQEKENKEEVGQKRKLLNTGHESGKEATKRRQRPNSSVHALADVSNCLV